MFCLKAHGWCAKKNACPFSHDIDTILNKEDQVRHKKRKRKRGKAKDGEEEAAAAGETSMEVQHNFDVLLCPVLIWISLVRHSQVLKLKLTWNVALTKWSEKCF